MAMYWLYTQLETANASQQPQQRTSSRTSLLLPHWSQRSLLFGSKSRASVQTTTMSGSSFRTALTFDSWKNSPSFFLNSSLSMGVFLLSREAIVPPGSLYTPEADPECYPTVAGLCEAGPESQTPATAPRVRA